MKRLLVLMVCVFSVLVGAFAQDTALLRAAFQSHTASEITAQLTQLEKSAMPEKQVCRVILLHNRALTGGEADVKVALYAAETVYASAKQPLAQGFLGSLTVILARYQMQNGDMQAAMANLESGIGHLSAAVAKEPGNIMLRIVRCEVFSAVSAASPVNKMADVKADVEYMKGVLASLPGAWQASVHLFAGLVAAQDKNNAAAMTEYESAIRCAPDSTAASRAKALLQQLEN